MRRLKRFCPFFLVIYTVMFIFFMGIVYLEWGRLITFNKPCPVIELLGFFFYLFFGLPMYRINELGYPMQSMLAMSAYLVNFLVVVLLSLSLSFVTAAIKHVDNKFVERFERKVLG